MHTEDAIKSSPSLSVLDDYLPEEQAAAEIGVIAKTLAEYRRQQIGPDYTIVARKIMYTRENLRTWLAAGGTRGRSPVIARAVKHKKAASARVR